MKVLEKRCKWCWCLLFLSDYNHRETKRSLQATQRDHFAFTESNRTWGLWKKAWILGPLSNLSKCYDAPDDGWWYHPKYVEQFPDKINCETLHLVGYILEYVRLYISVNGVRHPQHTQTGSNSSTIAAESSNGVKNTRSCRYSCLCSWWWVMVQPETCRAVSR
jgi:hypothetical protein